MGPLSVIGVEARSMFVQRRQGQLLRPIYINAVEVGYAYADSDEDVRRKLHVRGITIALWYFLLRGHQVIAFLPYCFKNFAEKSDNWDELMELYRMNLVEFTTGYGSAKYVEVNRVAAKRAREFGGCIVARSQMHSIIQHNPLLDRAIEKRLLMPTFNGDDIIFPVDGPLGRRGLSFIETLSCMPNVENEEYVRCATQQMTIKDQQLWLSKLADIAPNFEMWRMMSRLLEERAFVSVFGGGDAGSSAISSKSGGVNGCDEKASNDEYTLLPSSNHLYAPPPRRRLPTPPTDPYQENIHPPETNPPDHRGFSRFKRRNLNVFAGAVQNSSGSKGGSSSVTIRETAPTRVGGYRDSYNKRVRKGSGMSISTLRSQVKNVEYNFSDAQVKVCKATSNDPWGPTTALMSEIADLTHNPMSFTEIMSMLWKRLNDHGKNWRHVYKSLVLLDYLIKCGSEKVAQQCRENFYTIETLKDFQHIEDNRDQGLNVREKAKQMVALLNDEERLRNERARFLLTRKRFIQNGSAISSDGTVRAMRRAPETGVIDSEFEEARPSSIGEEEMQLQIAMALSREECEKEEELRKGDAIRLQIVLEESKRASANEHAESSKGQKINNNLPHNAVDYLLSLSLGEQTSFNSQISSTSAHAFDKNLIDQWSPKPSGSASCSQMYHTLISTHSALSHTPPNSDPWSSGTPKLSNNINPLIPMHDGTHHLIEPTATFLQNDPWESESSSSSETIDADGSTSGSFSDSISESDSVVGSGDTISGVNVGAIASPPAPDVVVVPVVHDLIIL